MKEQKLNREEIYKKLKEIFIDVFDNEDIEINDSTVSTDVEGWDSSNHIRLIGVIEDEFSIKFDMEALPKLRNVGAMVDMIQGLI